MKLAIVALVLAVCLVQSTEAWWGNKRYKIIYNIKYKVLILTWFFFRWFVRSRLWMGRSLWWMGIGITILGQKSNNWNKANSWNHRVRLQQKQFNDNVHWCWWNGSMQNRIKMGQRRSSKRFRSSWYCQIRYNPTLLQTLAANNDKLSMVG